MSHHILLGFFSSILSIFLLLGSSKIPQPQGAPHWNIFKIYDMPRRSRFSRRSCRFLGIGLFAVRRVPNLHNISPSYHRRMAMRRPGTLERSVTNISYIKPRVSRHVCTVHGSKFFCRFFSYFNALTSTSSFY